VAVGRHRAQFVLFAATVLLPCAALVWLGFEMARQDRWLSEKRVADERQRVLDGARKELLSTLGAIAREETLQPLEPGRRYRRAETVFVGWIDNGRLVLPWDTDADLAVRRAAGALAAGARNPAQAANARLRRAEACEEAGRRREAAVLFSMLLAENPAITDEDGVPVAVLAARGLLRAGGADERIAGVIEAALAARPWASPMSCLVLSEIGERLAPGEHQRAAADGIRRAKATTEQAEALRNDFSRLGIPAKGAPRWVPYGDDLWLAGAAENAIIAVRASALAGSLGIPGARLAYGADPAGDPLGANFPGLRLVVPAAAISVADPAGSLQRRFYYLALVLTVAATMFAAYLLWRDLKREVRLAELRSQFVSSVSHELRTPLTSIRMFAETLQMGRCAGAQAQAEYLGTIVNECERLSRLVEGVLLFSKSEQGKKVYRLRPSDLADAVRAAARALEYPLSTQGFRLRRNIAEGLPPVHADRDAIEQAVLNLLSNAMKFSGDARDIDLNLFQEDGEAVIGVADHGIGIAHEHQRHIFEAFYRAPTRDNQLIPGAGLGLALVAQIMKAHGGRVEVESEPGKGSTFYLRLPLEAGGREVIK
jgi:signal transduction histidine kinase